MERCCDQRLPEHFWLSLEALPPPTGVAVAGAAAAASIALVAISNLKGAEPLERCPASDEQVELPHRSPPAVLLAVIGERLARLWCLVHWLGRMRRDLNLPAHRFGLIAGPPAQSRDRQG